MSGPRAAGLGRRGAGLPVVAGGLVVLMLLQSIPNRHAMEDDLTRRCERALRAAGASTVEVRFTGRDGVVRVRSQADADRAQAVVRAQPGVRVARAEVVPGFGEPSQTGVTPAVDLAIDRGRVIATGTVGSAAARASLVDAAAAVYGSDAVDNRVEVRAGVADDGVADLGGVLRALGKDGTGVVIALSRGTIKLTGTVSSQAVKDAVIAAAGTVVRGSSAVVDDLQVATPQPPPPSPQEVQGRLAALAPVTFQRGSAVLTAEGSATIAQAAAILAANPALSIRIEGHTDSSGGEAANLALSQARAQAVVAALRAAGVAATRLTSTGFGESRPKVPDTTEANRTINRRVEFVVA